MKNGTKLILSAAITLALGAAVVVGNCWLAAQAMDAGLNADSPPAFADANPAPLAPSDPEQSDDLATIMKTLEDGTTVMVQYSLGEEGAKALVTRTQPNGEAATQSFEGDEAVAMVKRYAGSPTLTDQPFTYEDGQPGEHELDEQTAIVTGIAAITEHYALKAEVLERFSLSPAPRYYSQYEDIDVPVWWVNLYPTNTDDFSEIGCYTAILDAATGEALRLLSAADGKG